MKGSKVLVSILILVSLILASCAAPAEKNAVPVMETSAPLDMATMETVASTETQAVSLTPAQTQAATDDSAIKSEDSEVEIEDFAFVPGKITIKVGTTVTWTNKDSVRHTVTSDNGLFDSGLFGQGESYSFTFTEAGTFAYHCTPHPNMKATIIVE